MGDAMTTELFTSSQWSSYHAVQAIVTPDVIPETSTVTPAEIVTLQIMAHAPLNILDLKDVDMRSPPFLDIKASAEPCLLSSHRNCVSWLFCVQTQRLTSALTCMPTSMVPSCASSASAM